MKGDWRPIATAPKDKAILLWCPRHHFGEGAYAGWWNDVFHLGYGFWLTVGRLENKPGTPLYSTEPTHWMDFPDGPE
jgi:hypothetical protein